MWAFLRGVAVLSSAVLLWVLVFYGMSLACARLDLQTILGRYSDWLYLGIQGCGLLVGLIGAISLQRHILSWSKVKVCLGACLGGMALVAILMLGSFWLIFGMSDSDYQIVPSWDFNLLTDEREVPSQATNVHIMVIRGLSPVTYVTFRVSPEEAQGYLKGLVAAGHFTRGDLGNAELDVLPSRLSRKGWWRVRDDSPWWYMRDSDTSSFIQVDNMQGQVYMMYSIR
jgi:hypothetical protein